jgi:hypothetical protein
VKKSIIFAAMAAAAVAVPAMAGDIGLSISIGQPGFYGQLDIGAVSLPQPPAVIYTQPMVVQRGPNAAPPVYLHVPPGYEKHWARHCAEYAACGRPVYFVRDDWYQREYVPRYQQRRETRPHEERRDERQEVSRDHGDEHRKDRQGDRHDEGDHDR